MNTSKYILLLYKKLRGQLSNEEKKDLDHWLSDDYNQKTSNELSQLWSFSGQYKSDYSPDLEKGLTRFKDRIQSARPVAKTPSVLRVRRRIISWAAAVAVLLMALGWFYNQSDWFAAKQIASTPTDTTNEIILPDGSLVLLNENSSLHYPPSFDDEKKRMVEFEGEAYFKIQANPKQPFVIITPETEVVVLGTSFNLRAYPEENFTEIEVEEGEVMFMTKDHTMEMEVKVKDRCIFNHNGKMLEMDGQNLNAHSWRTRTLTFRGDPLSQVVIELERFFEINIELDKDLKNCPFNTVFDNKTRLEDVWGQIELSTGAKVEEASSGEAIIISGNSCD